MLKKHLFIFIIGISILKASSTGECSNSETVKYDKRCNPYKSHLIYVDKKSIESGKYIHNKKIYPKGISLQRAVDKYIDYQEGLRDKRLRDKYRQNSSIDNGLCEYTYIYFSRDRLSRNYKSFIYIFKFKVFF